MALTRGQVAKMLNKSVATVRRMEGNALHPMVDEKGVHRFDAREVRRVLVARRGEKGRPPVHKTNPARSEWFDAELEGREDWDDLRRDEQRCAENERFYAKCEEERRERQRARELEAQAKREREELEKIELAQRVVRLRGEILDELDQMSPRELRTITNDPTMMRTLRQVLDD